MKEEGRVKGKDESVEGKRGGEEDDGRGCMGVKRNKDREIGRKDKREQEKEVEN